MFKSNNRSWCNSSVESVHVYVFPFTASRPNSPIDSVCRHHRHCLCTRTQLRSVSHTAFACMACISCFARNIFPFVCAFSRRCSFPSSLGISYCETSSAKAYKVHAVQFCTQLKCELIKTKATIHIHQIDPCLFSVYSRNSFWRY